MLVVGVDTKHPVVSVGEGYPAQRFGEKSNTESSGMLSIGRGLPEGLCGFAVGIEATVVDVYSAVFVRL